MMISVIFYVMLETDTYGKLRKVFDSRQWRNGENVYLASDASAVDAPEANRECPFSDKTAKGSCPICCTCTSKDGYHHGDPARMHNNFGVAMIEYELARKALEREDSLVLGRIQLDTLVNYRGNYLFGTLSPSCKGCYMKTWCWNVGYRMTWQSTIVAFNAMLCSLIFQSDINLFYADLKNILLCISCFFSVSTLVMQLALLATAVVFINEHSFMDKSAIPRWLQGRKNSALMKVIEYFADPCAKYGVPTTKKYWSWVSRPPRKKWRRE